MALADILNLVERPDSPQETGQGRDKRITRLYNLDKGADLSLYIPTPFCACPDGFFLNWNRITQPGYDILSLTYTTNAEAKSGQPRTHQDGDEEWLIANSGIDQKPLEEHKNYLTKWNYDLYQWATQADATASKPAWYDTATNLSDAKGAEVDGSTGYLWSKEKPTAPKNGYWILYAEKTMPGVENFKYRPMTIHRIQYFAALADAETAYMNEPKLRYPQDPKGISDSTATDWLAYGAQPPQFDGLLWTVINEYVYNPTGWNTNLYETY